MATQKNQGTRKSDSFMALRWKACYYRRFSGVTF